jgi:hypothetical protein
MEEATSSVILVSVYQTTRLYISEDRNHNVAPHSDAKMSGKERVQENIL